MDKQEQRTEAAKELYRVYVSANMTALRLGSLDAVRWEDLPENAKFGFYAMTDRTGFRVGENKKSENLKITWLGTCPRCDSDNPHEVATEGDHNGLYPGDLVWCGLCALPGEIETEDGGAWVNWDI